MKTTAPEAPTSHTSARCSARTPGAATGDREASAVVAYAIGCSLNSYQSRHCERSEAIHIFPAISLDCFVASLLAMTSIKHFERSIRVLILRQQRQRRLQQNVGVEQRRPVLDVVEIELDALLDLLFVVDLAAPAVDLGPAGDTGLDAVAGEIAVNGLVEQAGLQLALHRVRARADQREVALEDDVEELRQLVKAGLADEAADAGDARIVPGDDLGGGRIGLVMVERAELEDVDALIVEAEALLPEQ